MTDTHGGTESRRIAGLWTRRAQAASALQEAHMRLLAVAGLESDGHLIAAELEHRRTRLGMTPQAAVESVYEDIAAGRWRP